MASDLTAYFNDTGLLTKNILFGQESGSISGLQEQGPAATKSDTEYRELQKAKAEKTSAFRGLKPNGTKSYYKGSTITPHRLSLAA